MLQSQGCFSQIADSPKPWYSTLNMIRFGEYLTPQCPQTFIWAPRVMLEIVFLEGFPVPQTHQEKIATRQKKTKGPREWWLFKWWWWCWLWWWSWWCWCTDELMGWRTGELMWWMTQLFSAVIHFWCFPKTLWDSPSFAQTNAIMDLSSNWWKWYTHIYIYTYIFI